MTVGERAPGTWPLGPVLAGQRNKLGLSLDAVAKRAGIGRATVTYYETGYRADNKAPVNPTVKILRPLAEALELDPDYVLDVAGLSSARRKTDEEAAAEVTRRSTHLANRIALLDPPFRSAIETIVDEYLKAQGYVADSTSAAEVKAGPTEPRAANLAAGPDEPPLGRHAGDQAPLSQ